MQGLTYNSNKDRYSTQLGTDWYLVVEGVEMAEATSEGGDLDELCADVTMWENLIGGNQNVYYANTPYGDDAYI
jgi:hypothetical protein